jgi:hypothetical protein
MWLVAQEDTSNKTERAKYSQKKQQQQRQHTYIHTFLNLFSYSALPEDLREFRLKNRLWLPSSYSDLLTPGCQ